MISVLLPVYNGEKYIALAIKSILNQTFKDFEFLIIDDGSKDNTENIVKSFKDKRIKYIKKTHTGLADTLNYGLKISKYDWIARMDADDISHPLRLEKQVRLIKKNISNMVIVTWAAYFKNKSILYSTETPIEQNNLIKKLALHCHISHPSVLYNRNFILNNNGYNHSLNSFIDYELWVRLKEKILFEVIPEYLLFIQDRKKSLSRGDNDKKIILTYLKKFYPLEDSNKFSKKEIFEIMGWREYFYGEAMAARKCWIKDIRILFNYRVLLASIITFLPKKFIEYLKSLQLRLRLFYILNWKSNLQSEFNKILKKLNYKPNEY